jgi:hypothetical protein
VQVRRATEDNSWVSLRRLAANPPNQSGTLIALLIRKVPNKTKTKKHILLTVVFLTGSGANVDGAAARVWQTGAFIFLS